MNKKYKLNMNIMGKKTGDIINVEVDSQGTPKDRLIRSYWVDSKIDNCMELVKQEKPQTKKVKYNDND